MPVEGVYVSPSGKKSFIPLENNPEVFTSLVHDLGVSPDLGFYDVYSLDEPDLLSLIPRPVLAIIFISPSDSHHAVRAEDGHSVGSLTFDKPLTYNGSGEAEPTLWFQQTIGNACGLYALLHCVANGEARDFVQAGSTLSKIIDTAIPLPPVERAASVYENDDLEAAHMRAARLGSTKAPPAEDHPDYHFIAFTRGKDGHLYELEGIADGPIDRGSLANDRDLLSEDATNLGIGRYLKLAKNNPNFSIVALAKRP